MKQSLLVLVPFKPQFFLKSCFNIAVLFVVVWKHKVWVRGATAESNRKAKQGAGRCWPFFVFS